LLVGFAAEVGASGEALVERARQKLADKRCDVVVANDVSEVGLGFGSDRNAVTLVFSDGGVVPLPAASKDALADDIWAHLAPLVETDKAPPAPRQLRAT
jgi:phosphopantothenoylcysteine decarboxylase/phosphopantothenate--cysteine ligase